MEREFLIDTNAVIDYLANKLPKKGADLLDDISIQLSIITRIELLSWPRAKTEQLKILEEFILKSTIFNLTESIIIKTINIRKYHAVKLPDAIIAATALTQGVTLVTRNLKDFQNISTLDLLNPYDL